MQIQSPALTRSIGWVVPVIFLATPVTKERVKSTLGWSVVKLEETQMPLKNKKYNPKSTQWAAFISSQTTGANKAYKKRNKTAVWFSTRGEGGGGGESQIKVTEVIVGILENNPKKVPESCFVARIKFHP